MENKEAIIKKIENLLALAGNNPNEHEAISAALKAQELMAKYNVEVADVEQSEFSESIILATYEIIEDIRYASKWKYALSEILSRNFCCKTYDIYPNSIVFYGYEKDAKIAREVFKYLYSNGNRLAEQYCGECQVKNEDKEGIMYAYLCGFCEGIEEALDKQCTALMLVIPKQIEDSFEEYSKDFKCFTNILMMTDDEDAYQTGKKEGKSILDARTIESRAS